MRVCMRACFCVACARTMVNASERGGCQCGPNAVSVRALGGGREHVGASDGTIVYSGLEHGPGSDSPTGRKQ